jgi:uncharacterized protein YabN with tetrapyrrole methylase and pyrophosphatase domain
MAERKESRESKEFARLVEVVRELRERCPWDREQTLAGAAKYLIEEAYEASDAIGRGRPDEIADELGDLMVQILFEATIAAERDLLTLDDLMRRAREKLVRRHPHVYAGAKAETVKQVVENWELIKKSERAAAAAEAFRP